MSVTTALGRYSLVGVFNTAVHGAVFFLLVNGAGWHQAGANGLAFGVAVSGSYVLNSRFTFKQPLSASRYWRFCLGMAALAAGLGWVGQRVHWPPLFTFLAFSATNAVVGFFYSQYVAFREAA